MALPFQSCRRRHLQNPIAVAGFSLEMKRHVVSMRFLHNCSIEKNAELSRLLISHSLALCLSHQLTSSQTLELFLTSLLFSIIFTKMGEKHEITAWCRAQCRRKDVPPPRNRRLTPTGTCLNTTALEATHLLLPTGKGHTHAVDERCPHASSQHGLSAQARCANLPVRFPLFRCNAKTAGSGSRFNFGIR
jgi:hypothetical protein